MVSSTFINDIFLLDFSPLLFSNYLYCCPSFVEQVHPFNIDDIIGWSLILFLTTFLCRDSVFQSEQSFAAEISRKRTVEKTDKRGMYHVLMIRKTGMKGRNEVESCSSPQKRGLFLSHQSSHPTLALIVVLEVCRNVVGACN